MSLAVAAAAAATERVTLVIGETPTNPTPPPQGPATLQIELLFIAP